MRVKWAKSQQWLCSLSFTLQIWEICIQLKILWRNTSKLAIFYLCSFFRFSLHATLFFYLMNFKLSKDIIFGASIYELYVQALKNSNPWGWMVYITILHSGLKSERSAIYGRWDRKCCFWKPKINIFWKNFEQNGIEEACAWF